MFTVIFLLAPTLCMSTIFFHCTSSAQLGTVYISYFESSCDAPAWFCRLFTSLSNCCSYIPWKVWILDYECGAKTTKRPPLQLLTGLITEGKLFESLHKHTCTHFSVSFLREFSQQECFPYLDGHYRNIQGYSLSLSGRPGQSRNFLKDGRGLLELLLQNKHFLTQH